MCVSQSEAVFGGVCAERWTHLPCLSLCYCCCWFAARKLLIFMGQWWPITQETLMQMDQLWYVNFLHKTIYLAFEIWQCSSTLSIVNLQANIQYKLNFHDCTNGDTWSCLRGDCGSGNNTLYEVKQESSGEWCQREGIMSRRAPSNAPFELWWV